MIKNILLATLCLPVAWIAYLEVQELVAAPHVEPVEPSQSDDLPKLLKTDNEAMIESAGALRSVMFGTDDPDRQTPSTELVSAVLEHEKARKRAHEAVSKMKQQAATMEADVLRLVGKLRSDGTLVLNRVAEREELQRLLDEYQANPAHRQELHRAARVLIDWIKLDQDHPGGRLAEFLRQLETSPLSADLVASVDRSSFAEIRAYRDFVRTHSRADGSPTPGENGDLIHMARRRLTRWELAHRLSELLAKDRGSVSWERRADQLRAILELAGGSSAASEQTLRRSARIIIGRLCEAIVPEEPLDEIVKSPARAEAVRAFNRRRARMTHWSAEEIKALLAWCNRDRPDRGPGGGNNSQGNDAVKRLERLLEIVEEHPSVFTSTP
jgi:hypothetical protein